ncbi:type II toxin-antitoxin system RelE/ParE family toxin [Leucobacter sp. G161]|uniref:type II toxin-antitoxin system RelE/ParE family toxin n=1 Tax=Leucobacter sp. G161 TaxID=663704 RepID=UPI00350F4484
MPRSEPLIWRDTAVRDVRRTVDWYISHGESNALERFLSSLDSMHETLQRFPSIGRRYRASNAVGATIRLFPLTRTPYVAIYAVDEGVVRILRVAHIRRDIRNLL